MPTPKPPKRKVPSDPAQMPDVEREYYQVTWGFDPVDDCQSRIHGERRYEACVPLEQDPPTGRGAHGLRPKSNKHSRADRPSHDRKYFFYLYLQVFLFIWCF